MNNCTIPQAISDIKLRGLYNQFSIRKFIRLPHSPEESRVLPDRSWPTCSVFSAFRAPTHPPGTTSGGRLFPKTSGSDSKVVSFVIL